MLRLPGHDAHRFHRSGVVDTDGLHQVVGAQDCRQRISQLMPQHRQEPVLASAQFRLGLVCLPQLPSGRSEASQSLEDTLVFAVKFPLFTMRYNPYGAYRLIVVLKWNQQRFYESRLGRERGKTAIGEIHQLGGVLVDAYPARARVPGHRAVSARGKHPGQRLPSKDIAFQYADPGGICPDTVPPRSRRPSEACCVGSRPSRSRAWPKLDAPLRNSADGRSRLQLATEIDLFKGRIGRGES